MPEDTGAAKISGPAGWGVVVVNWNTPRYTIECLESLLAAINHPQRVVVVDNASDDGSVATIAAWARDRGASVRILADGEESRAEIPDAWLLLIAGRTLRGFSANNNIGLRYFRDQQPRRTHVLLLNSDAVVERNFFDELEHTVVARPDGGLFTGTIYEYGDRSAVWYAGGTINPLRALVSHRTSAPSSDAPAATQFVCGCAMLIATSTMRVVGLLDECYDPAYCEDADYSLRVSAAGFALIYAPRATVYHRIGGTIGPAARSPKIAYSANRNRALMVAWNCTGWPRAAGLAYLLATKPGRALIEAASGRPRTGWAVLRGMLDGVITGLRPRPLWPPPDIRD